ncbi:hypothetical protein PFLmoz3_02670 [Pseudomonas fluorescens]|uniref:Uncharacterized protein n=1 Tax=Pseudomonas fluorescens TaxID=294 RepID=A0A120G7T0_PSEFL|nr:hypothetical protein PFLmoz3_02670 [Pseudomonas fluorescens]
MFIAPCSTMASRRMTVRAPGWFCTTSASASASQSPTTLISVTPSSSGEPASPVPRLTGRKVTEPASIW